MSSSSQVSHENSLLLLLLLLLEKKVLVIQSLKYSFSSVYSLSALKEKVAHWCGVPGVLDLYRICREYLLFSSLGNPFGEAWGLNGCGGGGGGRSRELLSDKRVSGVCVPGSGSRKEDDEDDGCEDKDEDEDLDNRDFGLLVLRYGLESAKR